MQISFPVNYPELIVQKSEGLTKTEQRLAALGYRTFLKLWSYPNPYKMQTNGKELCDLLVVFDNHIIIFSDKDCSYGDSGNAQVDWSRWYKKAIQKSAEQLVGAKNWIINYPDRIAIDAKCTQKFPFKIRITKNTHFHLVAIAHGATDSCKKYFSGGDGGLCINNQIVGNMHTGPDCQPFFVGKISTEDENFIHVFDDASYTNILQELDTIQDFLRYLEARKELLLTKAVFSESENNLLAQHLQGVIRGDPTNLHNMSMGRSGILFTGEHLPDVKKSAQYMSWKKEMQRSYFWDELLQKTFFFIENGLLRWTTQTTMHEQGQLFEYLAREDRAHRYVLSNGFLTFFSSVGPDDKGTRIIYFPDEPDTCYLLLLMPKKDYMEENAYRNVRNTMLREHCMITKLDYPMFRHIIGVAHESSDIEYSSEDFMYFDATEWSDEQQQEALSLKEEYQRMGMLARRSTVRSILSYDDLGK